MPRSLTLKDHQQEARLFSQRSLVVIAIVLLMALLLFAQLVNLQILQHERYTTLSNNNHLELIPIKPERGLIYDRHGVLLAGNIPIFSLELTPSHIRNMNKTIAELQQLVSISPEQVKSFHRLRKQQRSHNAVPLKLELSLEERAIIAVNQHRWPGVAIKARLIRTYPQGRYLAHVLGYVSRINAHELRRIDPVNYSASTFIGKLGIEKYYEKILHGRVGYQRVEIDASGRIVRVLQKTPPIPGNSLHLSIDAALQKHIYKALGKHRGAVVVVDPRNGEVLAMVSTPAYDPNPFVRGISSQAYKVLQQSPHRPLYNRAIRGQYPLASTIKPFLTLQGLDSESIDPSFKVWDPGWYKLPNSKHIYRDWKRRGHGWVNAHRAIVVSCDTFYYQLANLMGINQIHHVLTRFGFGETTGIDLHEELSGLIPNAAWKRKRKNTAWYPGDTLISGIGQGFMLTTPLQLAHATATLAARGKRIRPHILQRQVTPEQLTVPQQNKTEYTIKLNNPEVWDQITKAMVGVIKERHGTGYRFGRNTPYSVAAKTGTAQVFSAKFHAPFDDDDFPEHLRDHSLFIAFAPVQEPTVAIAVVVENSKIAAKIARQTMDFLLLPKRSSHPMTKTYHQRAKSP